MNAITAGAIDCDIHPGVPGIKALLPYMEPYWQDAFVQRGMDGFDMASYPPGAPISCRPDWRQGSSRPGSDVEQLRGAALDAFGTRFAICNPIYGGWVAVNETMGAAICSAINDWIADKWLSQDARLRASIVVPAQSPLLAAQEIERKAVDKRFVQVLMPAGAEMLYGKSYYWPIFDAAVKHDLPVGIHAGSMFRYAPTSNGWPSYYLHDYVSQPQIFEDQILSLINEGTFVKFPSLRFVLLESGVTWLPGFIWRAIKTWRGVRAEVPWVKRSPAEYIRDHFRLSMQPFDAPPDPTIVAQLLDEIGSDEMLLFATDWPHWQFEGTNAIPAGFSAALLRKIMIENPLATYPRLKETIA